jgi:hypothetical protein
MCFESEQLSISGTFIKSVVNFQFLSYGEVRVGKIYFPGKNGGSWDDNDKAGQTWSMAYDTSGLKGKFQAFACFLTIQL